MAEITGDTRLSGVLDSIPGALEYIVSLDPHDFGRLRNATLRRYMASRISLRRVAAIAKIPEEHLVDDLTRLSNGDQPEALPRASVADQACSRQAA
ncbi:MAG: DUF1858 domain-containing protein [Chloroflexi bacterium]|nr:DUF1858 domain-containing protein [Chloroflexota bacterium]